MDRVLNKNNKFPLLAIDGGGTKTVAVITDDTGKILAAGRSGTANYHVVGKLRAKQTIKNAITNALNELEIEYFNAIHFNKAVFAIAGIDTNIDQANVEEFIREAINEFGIEFNKITIENDALSVLLGATNNRPGVILISGTGSIVYAHDGNNQYVRTGGVGHILGDEGSGYWIGKEAIRSIFNMQDGRGSKTILKDLVLAHFDFTNHEELYNWVYGPDFSIHKVAALTKIVLHAYEQGDLVSDNIIDCAVDELYHLTVTAVNRAGIADKSFKLLLLGGVLENSALIKEKLINKLKDKMPQMELIIANKKPIEFIIQRGLNG